MKLKARIGQHVLDVLLQESGSIENMHSFLRANDLNAAQHFSGQDIEGPELDNEDVVDYFRRRNIIVSTGEHNELQYPGGSYSNDYSNDYD
jgi:hypothetical protein